MSEEVNPQDILNEILQLARQGYKKSDIGRVIREKYGKSVKELLGKKLEKILEENGIKEEIPEDLLAIFKRINKMIKHLEVHKKDMHTKKRLEEYEKSVQCLIKYYKRIGKLPKDFKYTREVVKMYAT